VGLYDHHTAGEVAVANLDELKRITMGHVCAITVLLFCEKTYREPRYEDVAELLGQGV
jgi:hypothetical protein